MVRKERLNGSQAKDAKEDRHTDDLRALAKVAGSALSPRDPLAPSWHVVLPWDRNQDYDRPLSPAGGAVEAEAVFGPEGVVTWIRSSLT